ncbi:hypothetical protein D1631_11500 [Chryseobacterium nematophagum]|uniref:Uncharacterized protein n=1 Tax=Chryseobacterium nematophagum TaxID=2305228 RepID=A0A3M7THE0_9FLAO|nr:hypothetical protein [Chryseobacterium nematophagum]RNA62514.1 hypothetical protein D1631_11500 [Chryseobacterium nematophagum]
MKKNILLFGLFVVSTAISCNTNSDSEMINELTHASMNRAASIGNSSDLIYNNPNPISLNFTAASKKALNTPIDELTSLQEVQILYFRDREIGFNAILPVAVSYKAGFTPARGVVLGKAYYFPYKTNPNPNNFLATVGNVEVKLLPTGNDPQYVLTGEMNGCSLIVTKSPNESNFRVWHFPSPDSYKTAYNEFKKKFKGQIYGEIKYADYGGDVSKGEIDGVNYLYYNNSINKWELTCIPTKRIIEINPQKLALWMGNWAGKSNVPRFKRILNFVQPIE